MYAKRALVVSEGVDIAGAEDVTGVTAIFCQFVALCTVALCNDNKPGAPGWKPLEIKYEVTLASSLRNMALKRPSYVRCRSSGRKYTAVEVPFLVRMTMRRVQDAACRGRVSPSSRELVIHAVSHDHVRHGAVTNQQDTPSPSASSGTRLRNTFRISFSTSSPVD